ncbi:hypothetical protein LS633_00355 [Pseudomonas sp. NIBR-H-19]|uniref:hypothetical protein n=1 Tax=Pseudomonas TaxID=286 RepID=UPI0014762D21|nr:MULTISPECIES: hypothetical protein [Pseudomonas]MCT8955133.1 hypothetical protein [Pseudomonas lundensis]NNA14020.1 hypothetical protein [Pseudomonas lundensis]UHC81681.1 hypothetical protein LS633_25280 [Pseudomonas sp. NIBR-H-19]UHC82331.1 hypothetical protein LS633_00355 [Pseudomonas sp. NIBR-H-19]
MSGDSTKDWAEAHWAPLTGENTELTQFNIWHHRRFGFVDHRDAACGSRWLVWTASREALVIELPEPYAVVGDYAACGGGRSVWDVEYSKKIDDRMCAKTPVYDRASLEAAGVRVKS